MLSITSAGVIGLHSVGATVARQLLDQGLEVTVHDPDPWTVAMMAAAGATPARIPADAAEPADVVFVHLPDETAVEEALFDYGGVGETLRDGGFVVAASATGASFVLSAADRLGALGLKTVEAWFIGRSGGPPDTVLVGCAPEELEALAPIFGVVAVHVARIGPLGSVSALRAAATALAAAQPLPFKGGLSAAGADLRQPLTELLTDASSGTAPDRRSGWCGAQSMSASTQAVAETLGDGRPVPNAQQQMKQPPMRIGALAPRGPQRLEVSAERSSRLLPTVSDVPQGVLTLKELIEVVDAVCRRDRGFGSTRDATIGGPPPAPTA